MKLCGPPLFSVTAPVPRKGDLRFPQAGRKGRPWRAAKGERFAFSRTMNAAPFKVLRKRRLCGCGQKPALLRPFKVLRKKESSFRLMFPGSGKNRPAGFCRRFPGDGTAGGPKWKNDFAEKGKIMERTGPACRRGKGIGGNDPEAPGLSVGRGSRNSAVLSRRTKTG